MELIGKISLFIHIFAGVSTLIAGPIALFYQRNSKKHVIAGKVFNVSMMIIIVTSIFKFLRVPDNFGYQFLFGISILVGFNLFQGIRSIRFMKGKQPGHFDRTFIWVFILTGIGMMNAGIYHLMHGHSFPLAILFLVFGVIVMTGGLKFRRFLVAGNISSRWWLRLHIDAMMGAFIASTTAFTVNAADFLPWYAQWFGPAIVMQPLLMYFMAQRKLRKKDLGNPFKKQQPVVA